MLIADIYKQNPDTISEDTTIKEALEYIMDKHDNALLITKNEKIIGILSIQDIVSTFVPNEYKDNVNLASATYKHGFFKQQVDELKDTKVQ